MSEEVSEMAKRKGKKSRTRRAAASAGSVGFSVAAGGVAALGIQAMASRVEFIRDNWYAAPLAIGAVGYMLRKRRKWSKASGALLGICGYSLVQQYQITHQEASGYGDAGALLDPGEEEILTSHAAQFRAAPPAAQVAAPAPVAVPVESEEAEVVGLF